MIENTFGILAACWRIFRRPNIADPSNIELFTKAAIALHISSEQPSRSSIVRLGSLTQKMGQEI